MAYVMPGSWKSALIPFFARIPRRVGNLREMRYGLLTDIVPLPDAVKRRTAQAYFGLAQGGTFPRAELTVDAGNQAALLGRFGLAVEEIRRADARRRIRSGQALAERTSMPALPASMMAKGFEGRAVRLEERPRRDGGDRQPLRPALSTSPARRGWKTPST